MKRTCSECDTALEHEQAITCSNSCRNRRWRRKAIKDARRDALSEFLSPESVDICMAADALHGTSLDTLIQVFHMAANKPDRASAEREMFHSVLRLLDSVRRKRTADTKAMEREIRKARASEPAYPA